MQATLTYGSVCSGMEAATLAWQPLGWKCAFVSEIDKAPSALLAQRYPDVPNLGDMTKFEDWPDYAIDLLVGGTPCQSFSVAGLRKGLADPRGSLMLTYGAIAKRYRPTWLLWENVPGVLSSNEGRDFGAFLGMLAELGYGFAYRVLDAQFFRLAQRRKRVFVVGYLGDWRPPAAVLFESESLRGDSPPRRETGQRPAPTISARTKGGGGLGTDAELDGALIPEIARTLLGKDNSSHAGTPLVPVPYTLAIRGRGDSHDLEYRQDGVANAVLTPNGGRAGIGVGAIAFSCKDHGADASELAPTLRAMGHAESHANAGGQVAVAFNITPSNSNKDFNARQSDRAQAVTTQGGAPSARGGDVIVERWAVRRLTPLECERLQGAPDDYTNIAYRGRNTIADGPRYKMIGNSFAVNCVRWIGQRISQTHGLKSARLEEAIFPMENKSPAALALEADQSDPSGTLNTNGESNG